MGRIAKRLRLIAVAAAASGALAAPARAEDPIRVVTTLQHLAAHARAVGGDRVEVTALARGDQDPHFIQPTPALMVAANKADAYIEVGLELELWSEHVLDGARNAKVRVGFPGHIFAATGIPVLQRPAVISRAQGDVHPSGNPHVWLDPVSAILEARNVADGLKRLDPAGEKGHEERFARYKLKIAEAHYGAELVRLLGIDTLSTLDRKGSLTGFLEKKSYKGEPLARRLGGWRGKMLKHKGTKLLSYHQEFVYLASAFELDMASTLEPKPGIPPTPGHLAELEKLCAQVKIGALVCAPYNNLSIAEPFSERAGIPLAVVPSDVGAVEEAKDYLSLMDTIVGRLDAALSKGGKK